MDLTAFVQSISAELEDSLSLRSVSLAVDHVQLDNQARRCVAHCAPL